MTIVVGGVEGIVKIEHLNKSMKLVVMSSTEHLNAQHVRTDTRIPIPWRGVCVFIRKRIMFRKPKVTDNGLAPVKNPIPVCAKPEPYILSDVPGMVMLCIGNIAGLLFEFLWVVVILAGVALMAGYTP